MNIVCHENSLNHIHNQPRVENMKTFHLLSKAMSENDMRCPIFGLGKAQTLVSLSPKVV